MTLTPRWRTALTAAATTIVLAALSATSADAATLFSDDFDDGAANGWSRSGGSWSVASGSYQQTGTSASAKAQAGDLSWTDYSVRARVRPDAFGGSSSRAAGIAARAQSMSNFYSLVLTPDSVQLRRGSTTLASAGFEVSTGTWYTLTLTVSGSTLTGSVDGTELVSAGDAAFGSGRIGLVATYAAATYDDVSVFTGTAPEPTPTASPTGSPTPAPTSSPPAPGRADGFATGVTGGAGGQTVTVTSSSELADYVGRPGPYIILVSGRISAGGMLTVVADKSIIGVGANAEITGGGLQMGSTTRPGHNVIIRNIKFTSPSDDSVSVTNGARGVWIDHNEFFPGSDGSLDIKRQSTNVTVSWNVFHGTDKTMLLGHSDNYTADVGYLKVTYHHNYFNGSNQRHPRARFGEPVHVYNNYYRDIGLYGIASTQNAGLVVEGNYFENVAFPCYSTSGYADSDPGRLVQRGNIFVNSGECEAGGSVQEPSSYYPYTLDDPSTVPSRVIAGAGVGRI